MMKNIAKHTLLLGAFAMLLSTMPMQAMETASPDVQQEVTTKQGFFGRWTERAKNLRMKNLIKELNRAWNPFIKCVEKGDENCSQRAKVVRNIITSILALVAIAGVGAAGVAITRRLGRGAPAATPYTARDQRLIKAVTAFQGRVGDDQEKELMNLVGIPNEVKDQAMIDLTTKTQAALFTRAGLDEAARILKNKGITKGYFNERINLLKFIQ